MWKSAFFLGIAMLVVQAFIKSFLPFLDWYGVIPGVLGGSVYVALHKISMVNREKLKALLVFIIVAGLATLSVGVRHIGEYSAVFALSVSAILTLLYAFATFIGLTLGSFFYARVMKYSPWGSVKILSMKNSYVLGILMISFEMLINLAYKALTGSAGTVSGIGILTAMFAGQMYALWHKEKMPAKERFKALGVYFVIVAVIGVIALRDMLSTNPGLAAIIAGVFFLVYGALMYFMMGWGSSLYVKALEKQAAKMATATPPQVLQK